MKEVELCKLQRISDKPEHINWYYGHLLIKVRTGNMMVKSSNFHKEFWIREFCTSEDEFNKIEVIPSV
jgi:hypothetical protein